MVGKVITVEGSAVNAKLGAMLLGDDDQTLWIDGLQSWPEGFYQGGQRGRRVRVTGTVVSRDDVPVVREGDEPIAQGVPVPAGTDMEAARLRYLLIDASWTPVD